MMVIRYGSDNNLESNICEVLVMSYDMIFPHRKHIITNERVLPYR